MVMQKWVKWQQARVAALELKKKASWFSASRQAIQDRATPMKTTWSIMQKTKLWTKRMMKPIVRNSNLEQQNKRVFTTKNASVVAPMSTPYKGFTAADSFASRSNIWFKNNTLPKASKMIVKWGNMVPQIKSTTTSFNPWYQWFKKKKA